MGHATPKDLLADSQHEIRAVRDRKLVEAARDLANFRVAGSQFGAFLYPAAFLVPNPRRARPIVLKVTLFRVARDPETDSGDEPWT